eukprot:CFRG0728T1
MGDGSIINTESDGQNDNRPEKKYVFGNEIPLLFRSFLGDATSLLLRDLNTGVSELEKQVFDLVCENPKSDSSTINLNRSNENDANTSYCDRDGVPHPSLGSDNYHEPNTEKTSVLHLLPFRSREQRKDAVDRSLDMFQDDGANVATVGDTAGFDTPVSGRPSLLQSFLGDSGSKFALDMRSALSDLENGLLSEMLRQEPLSIQDSAVVDMGNDTEKEDENGGSESTSAHVSSNVLSNRQRVLLGVPKEDKHPLAGRFVGRGGGGGGGEAWFGSDWTELPHQGITKDDNDMMDMFGFGSILGSSFGRVFGMFEDMGVPMRGFDLSSCSNASSQTFGSSSGYVMESRRETIDGSGTRVLEVTRKDNEKTVKTVTRTMSDGKVEVSETITDHKQDFLGDGGGSSIRSIPIANEDTQSICPGSTDDHSKAFGGWMSWLSRGWK